MLNKILATIGIHRPKNPPPITAEEWEVFNRSKELLEEANLDDLSCEGSFDIQKDGDFIHFRVGNVVGKYIWPQDFLYMDHSRTELGEALYKFVRERIEKRNFEYRRRALTKFLGRENGGGNSVTKPKPQAPPNQERYF